MRSLIIAAVAALSFAAAADAHDCHGPRCERSVRAAPTCPGRERFCGGRCIPRRQICRAH